MATQTIAPERFCDPPHLTVPREMPIKVRLTKGKVALVSPEDAERVLALKWHASRARCRSSWYARRVDGGHNKHGLVLMHRLITGAPAGMQVDHVNGNGLDNRRENLRVCSPSENLLNQRRTSDRNKYGFRGVMATGQGRYRARICVNGKIHYFGTFATPEEASQAFERGFSDVAPTWARRGR